MLVWRDPLFVLDLGLDIIDGVAGLDLEGDGLAREGLDKAGVRVSRGGKESRKARRSRLGKAYICTVGVVV